MATLRYHDQNNNLYHLEDQHFRYHPVQPKESSSGRYSGGEPAKHQISETLSQQIFAMAEEILQDSRLHTEQRRMMTAILSLKSKDDGQRVILSRSKLRSEFENLLGQAKTEA